MEKSQKPGLNVTEGHSRKPGL